ncbi:MAG: rRNA maturation RNase YbeY [Elusimicrobia bacterium RIFOXYA12_FULL_57_11]|nr:MAG: rRNA maturation RNase YbeY [Elusimicrobia bacterium RIFOXYA12_FULL_57_11]
MLKVFFEAKAPAQLAGKAGAFKKAVLAGLGRALAAKPVNLVFTGDAAIKSLNRRFLKRNGLTDVIAFNYPPSPAPGAVWGEIYICLPQAGRQAAAMGHSLMAELLVLAVHGALHLAGMDDGTPGLRAKMNKKTASLLKKIFK